MICGKLKIFEKIDKTFNNIFKHPTSVCMTYTEHAKFSFYISYVFLKGSVMGLIHSVHPDSYITYAQDTIKEVNKLLNDYGCKN